MITTASLGSRRSNTSSNSPRTWIPVSSSRRRHPQTMTTSTAPRSPHRRTPSLPGRRIKDLTHQGGSPGSRHRSSRRPAELHSTSMGSQQTYSRAKPRPDVEATQVRIYMATPPPPQRKANRSPERPHLDRPRRSSSLQRHGPRHKHHEDHHRRSPRRKRSPSYERRCRRPHRSPSYHQD